MTTQITIHPPAESAPSLSPYQARMPKAPEISNDGFFSSFKDALDVVNPLQHIPVVSTLYRELTGSTVSYGARILGGAIFGGPIGLIASIASSIIEEETGRDVGSSLFAMAAGKYETAVQLDGEQPS